MDQTPEKVAREYFSRVRARDLGVVDLFSEDAVLLGLGARVHGRAAIREFYSKSISDAGPTPSEPIALFSEAGRVFAEVYIQLNDGTKIHAIDVFEVEAGLIRSLLYFIADYPAA